MNSIFNLAAAVGGSLILVSIVKTEFLYLLNEQKTCHKILITQTFNILICFFFACYIKNMINS